MDARPGNVSALGRVTVKTLAKMAGVSTATISRALQGREGVGAEMRRRIQRLAKKAGYRPDPVLSALIAYRSRQKAKSDFGKIAVLNGWRCPEADLPGNFREELQGLRRKAEQLGYLTELFPLEADEASQKRLSRMLASRGIRGVAIGPLPVDWPPLCLDWKHFSSVAMGHSVMSPKLHYAAANHFSATEMAYRRLKKMGYRKIGFCDSAISDRRTRHLNLGSYLQCLACDGIPLESSPPLLFEPDKEWDLQNWVDRYGFDAILGGHWQRLREKLEQSGRKIPRDIGLAGFAIYDQTKKISGIRDDLREVGSSAMELLHMMLLTREQGLPTRPHVTLVEGLWQDGRTVRPQTSRR